MVVFGIVLAVVIFVFWLVEEKCHPNPFDPYWNKKIWERAKTYFQKREQIKYSRAKGFYK